MFCLAENAIGPGATRPDDVHVLYSGKLVFSLCSVFACMSGCVCACMSGCVCACMSGCVCACMSGCVRACMSGCVCVHVCVHVCDCSVL